MRVRTASGPLTGPGAVPRDPSAAGHGCCRDCHELALEQVELAEDRPGGAPIQGVPVRCGQRSEQIADAMTAVTASGWEISVRCDPPWKMVMWECARWAIESSEAAVMI